MKIKSFVAFLLALSVSSVFAITPQERKEILDAARPVAAQKAGTPVRIKVDKINIDKNWAILIGELVALKVVLSNGKKLRIAKMI